MLADWESGVCVWVLSFGRLVETVDILHSESFCLLLLKEQYICSEYSFDITILAVAFSHGFIVFSFSLHSESFVALRTVVLLVCYFPYRHCMYHWQWIMFTVSAWRWNLSIRPLMLGSTSLICIFSNLLPPMIPFYHFVLRFRTLAYFDVITDAILTFSPYADFSRKFLCREEWKHTFSLCWWAVITVYQPLCMSKSPLTTSK